MNIERFRRGSSLAFVAVLASACIFGNPSSSGAGASNAAGASNVGGGGGGTSAGCPLYAGSLAASCPSGEDLVCGTAGQPTACCPAGEPYYCAVTSSCYATPDAASQACGGSCQQCVPLVGTSSTATTSTAGTSTSTSGAPSCNLGTIFQPIEPPGSPCPTGHACAQPPYSCVTEQAIMEGLVCCCDPAGTLCTGCKPTETCSGAYNGSAVSCCSQ